MQCPACDQETKDLYAFDVFQALSPHLTFTPGNYHTWPTETIAAYHAWLLALEYEDNGRLRLPAPFDQLRFAHDPF